MRLHVVLLTLIFVVGSSIAATTIKGNSGSSSTTFTFSVGPYGFYGGSSANSMITGAAEVVANNTFSVAAYSSSAGQFIPLGVHKVTLNNIADRTNPLTGQKIKFIHVHQGDLDVNIPSLVTDKEHIDDPVPNTERFMVVTSITLPQTDKPTNTSVSLTQSQVPNDSAENPCGYIVGLSSAHVSGQGTGNDLIFGAVTQSGNNFGTGNSGIAVASYKITSDKDNKKAATLTLVDAQTGSAGNRAVTFNTATDALKVGSDLQSFEVTALPVIDMHWDSYLQRLFIAVRVTAADGASNGARAIVIGRINNQKLVLESFIPDDIVLASSNNIIVGANNGRSVSIYKVRTMLTSTGLSYLIVNGGNNAAVESGIQPVANKVFALPLVDKRSIVDSSWRTNSIHATAAAVDQTPTTNYNDVTARFLYRQFKTPATTVAQLAKETDTAAIVGAGLLPLIPTVAPDDPHVIKDMFIAGDAVYVCVAADYDNDGDLIQEPGVFQSRAIFDEKGRIASWTPWQRVAGSDDFAYGAGLDQKHGNFWLLTGNDDDHVNTIKKTLWGRGDKDGLLGGTTSDSSVGLINVLSQQFPLKYGGIQVASDFDAYLNSSGLPHSGLTGTTVLLTSGYHKFAFILTGDNSEADGTIKPYTGDFATGLVTGTNNNFPNGSGRVFIITGDVLNNIGPLTTHTIFSNDTYSWIAIGGINGLAILSDAHGSGFTPDSLPIGSTFKKAGNYAYVQKVLGDGQYLYILTTSSFERITINPTTFANGKIERTILASTFSLGINKYGCFFDVIIADKLALLATSKGLFRIANGCSVKQGVPGWTAVSLGESIGPVYNLSYAACDTDYNTGLANKGQVYVLAAYQGLDEAQLYRFAINEGSSLSNTSVQIIGDVFIENIPSYFTSFGQFRSAYADDGALRLVVRPVNDPRTLALYALPTYLHSGFSFATKNSTKLIAGVGARGYIGQPFRLSSSGAWLVPGDFGLQVNE